MCTKQFCSYRDNAEAFGALGATAVGISGGLDSHRGSAEKHDLTVPLLADDPAARAAEPYGARRRDGHQARGDHRRRGGRRAPPPRPPSGSTSRRSPTCGRRSTRCRRRRLSASLARVDRRSVPGASTGRPARPTAATPAGWWPAAGAAPRRCRSPCAPAAARATLEVARVTAAGRAPRRRHARRRGPPRRAAAQDAPDAVPATRRAAPRRRDASAGPPSIPSRRCCRLRARRAPGRRHAHLPGGCRLATGSSPPTGPRTSRSADGGRGAARVRVGRARLSHERARWPTSAQGPPVVLARLTARIGCPVRVGEPHTLLSWRSAHDGRKRHAGRARSSTRTVRVLAPRVRSGSSCARWLSRCPWPRPDALTTAPAPSARPPAASRSRLEGTRGRAGPGRRATTSSATASSAPRPPAQAAARGPGPADRAARPAATGELVEATWDEAFEEIDRRLSPILAEHGRERRGRVRGQPERPQSLGAHLRARCGCGRSGHRTSTPPSTVDQMPKQVSAGLMFGTILSHPVPDVDRSDHLLILGANPLVSNGSLLTAPDMRGRLRAHPRARRQGRGGRPAPHPHRRGGRRAPLHPPGHGRAAAGGMARTLFEEGLVARARWPSTSTGSASCASAGAGSRPSAWRRRAASTPAEIRRMARELAARRARRRLRPHRHLHAGVRHARQLAGGRAQRAHRQPRPRGRRHVHARGRRPEQLQRRPRPGQGRAVRALAQPRARAARGATASCPWPRLAEEIDTPGEGQVRALITVAGNPVVSTPNAGRLERGARERSTSCSRVDIYVNETTRHADVILPAPEPLEKSHYDLALTSSPPATWPTTPRRCFERRGGPPEWEMLAAARADRVRARAPTPTSRPSTTTRRSRRWSSASSADPASRSPGATRPSCWRSSSRAAGPSGSSTSCCAPGPYGDPFGADPDGLSLDALERNPHGDRPRPAQRRGSPRCCARRRARSSWRPSRSWPTSTGCEAALARKRNGGMVLIGRRQLRSNNSWMHNLPALVKGKDRCTLHVHPDDAQRLGLDGRRAGPGALGRGIGGGARGGHRRDHARRRLDPARLGPRRRRACAWRVAAEHAGVNSNVLADESLVEPLSGNAVLNGIPVEVQRRCRPC